MAQNIDSSAAAEIADRTRFAFGENWAEFLQTVDEHRIALAETSLRTMLGLPRLDGLRFIDVGSGSGLFSLAARRLGATVFSFDFDTESVRCTAELRRRFFGEDDHWTVAQGSILDPKFVATLGTADVVYSWGVLHHTGDQWRSLDAAAALVEPGGKLAVALYNDQGRMSRWWYRIKRAYNAVPGPLRMVILALCWVRLWGPTMIRDLLKLQPVRTWRQYAAHSLRGMSAWHDLVDWVGGYPFEVAKPETVFEFLRARGFQLAWLRTCAGGHGCNEYVFVAESE